MVRDRLSKKRRRFEVRDPPPSARYFNIHVQISTGWAKFVNHVIEGFLNKTNCAKRSLRSSASQKQMYRPFESSFESSFVRIFDDFYQKNMRGGHMPLNSESLKHRFWKFWKKWSTFVLSMANATHFWSGFGRLFCTFLKKVETSYSGRLRAPAVHGVSSYW